ncbi:hypothetical protein LCGC14_2409900 [marine sediment metagenome]|uniref:Uncharacterized protein n=1 Tax=marine sediment metagenome TaxID=412755 RepID=A0A0F9BSN6_9ZZZZ
MNKNFQELVNECNVEITRLKSIIPGLQCTDKLMSARSQPLIITGYVDEAWPLFCVDSLTEGSEILASRLLDSHIELMNRLYENVVALENITGEQRWIPKES